MFKHGTDSAGRLWKGLTLLLGCAVLLAAVLRGASFCLCSRAEADCARVCHSAAGGAGAALAAAEACPHVQVSAPDLAPRPFDLVAPLILAAVVFPLVALLARDVHAGLPAPVPARPRVPASPEDYAVWRRLSLLLS